MSDLHDPELWEAEAKRIGFDLEKWRERVRAAKTSEEINALVMELPMARHSLSSTTEPETR